MSQTADDTILHADPCSIALTGGDISLLPDFGGVMVRSLMLTRGVSHVYTARDSDTGALVGFTIFALPGQLMCSTYSPPSRPLLWWWTGMTDEVLAGKNREKMDG